jgi:hypothetical protein
MRSTPQNQIQMDDGQLCSLFLDFEFQNFLSLQPSKQAARLA